MNVGVISDTHFPAAHPAALQFILDTFDKWQVTQVVHIGDVTDLHNSSFHDKHPDMPGARDEFELAKQDVLRWNLALIGAGFVGPSRPMQVCIGNHDDRPARIAAKFGMAAPYLATFHDPNLVWGDECVFWEWAEEHEIDSVMYMHGHQKCGGGEHPAYLTLKKGFDMNLVLGHYHTRGGITPLPGRKGLRWGMSVGSLVDRKHPAMKYAEGGAAKQMMSCGVVIDGHPYYEMMPCGPGEKYHRSRFASPPPVVRTATPRITEQDVEDFKLVEWILNRGGSVTVRDVYSSLRRYRPAPEAEAALEVLAFSGYGAFVDGVFTLKGNDE